MTLRAVAWALGGLALAAVLRGVLRAALPTFPRPLSVGAIAGGLRAQFARGLDARGYLRMLPAPPALAGHGAAIGLFAALGVTIQGGRPA